MEPGRIMALDYGAKRTGIAVTDPLRIVSTGLDTVATYTLPDFLQNYFSKEKVICIVIGLPVHADGSPTALENDIIGLIRKIEKKYPDIKIERIEESFTSAQAKQSLLVGGTKQKKRRDKSLIDKISAVILLQEFMDKNLS